VRGRLAEPDAVAISDRAIARELGVSQPFVSALRRLSHGAPGAGAPDTVSDPAPLAENATSSPAAPRPTGDDDVLSGETVPGPSAADDPGDPADDMQVRPVRWVRWHPEDDDASHALKDWDPFA